VHGRAVGRIGLVAILAVTGGFFVLAGIAARGVGVFVAFPFGSAAIFLIAAVGAARGHRWGVDLAVPAGFVTCVWVLASFALAFLGMALNNSSTMADVGCVLIWLSAALGLSFAVGVVGLAIEEREPAPPARPGWGAHLPASETPLPLWVRVLVAVALILWALSPLIEDLLPPGITFR
jgi:hypothetical protein